MIALVKSDRLSYAKVDVFGISLGQRLKAARELFRTDLIEFHKTLTPAQQEKAAWWIKQSYKNIQVWFK